MADDQQRAVAIAAVYKSRAAHCRQMAMTSTELVMRTAYVAIAYSYETMANGIPLLPDPSTLPDPSPGSTDLAQAISRHPLEHRLELLERRRKDGSDVD